MSLPSEPGSSSCGIGQKEAAWNLMHHILGKDLEIYTNT
jgi:hypothetical protein